MISSDRTIKFDINSEDSITSEVVHQEKQLLHHFADRMFIQPALNRSIVSFQANKTRSIYRWYKFKEAFSAILVEFLFDKYGINNGTVLDPFAGSGTALFAASNLGLAADGIELLPLGHEIINARKVLENEFNIDDISNLKKWQKNRYWEQVENTIKLNELNISFNAYPDNNREYIEKYLTAIETETEKVKMALRFALLCILESISYTRKDGQHLRWDYRSGRRQGKKIFNKGVILDFNQAICNKLNEIITDISNNTSEGLFPQKSKKGTIKFYQGSCLTILPKLINRNYQVILTSPPYCNRYDYTRTYALELALFGLNEHEIKQLRQEMLSCTVENREKDLLRINNKWKQAIIVAEEQLLLQSILKYLNTKNEKGELNNKGIPRMVKGYFYEMACVIAECYRVMRSKGLLFMVNDNVRYGGVSISVDLILSDFAEKLGFQVENILILPNGKGNSSQQMRKHGRDELRKCVYIWRKI